MDIKVVTTISGELVPREECRYIKGNFYKIGDPNIKDSGDCYKINDRYYRASTSYIVFDEYKKEYVINNDTIKEGIIDFSDEENPILGFFVPHGVYSVDILLLNGTHKTLMHSSLVKDNLNYRYCKSADSFVHITQVTARQINEFPHTSLDDRYSLQYNCDNYIGAASKKFDATDLIIDKSISSFAPSLKDLTFGWEYETTHGKVPARLVDGLGLMPLRDGSIGGLEYASIPLQGEKGMQATKLACKALSSFTKYDDNCSLHLHVGNIPRNKKFLVALLKVLCNVQEEMYSLFPIFKQYNFGVKRKNYTKPLPALRLLSKMDDKIDDSNIDKNFDVLFEFLSMGIPLNSFGSTLEEVTHHPSDPRGTSKWNIRSRYYYVNLIPIVFGNKQTVEFRIHTPTDNSDKVLLYLFMCGGIVNYVKDNYNGMLKTGECSPSLADMMFSVYRDNSALCDKVTRYIENRRGNTYEQNCLGNIKGAENEIRVPSISGPERKRRGHSSSESARLLDSLYGSVQPPTVRASRETISSDPVSW